MEYLKDKLDRRMWDKEDGFESSYSNNMVTKAVEAYSKDDLVCMVSYTKSAGYSLELFERSEKGFVQTLYYNGDIYSKEKLNNQIKSLVDNYSLNS